MRKQEPQKGIVEDIEFTGDVVNIAIVNEDETQAFDMVLYYNTYDEAIDAMVANEETAKQCVEALSSLGVDLDTLDNLIDKEIEFYESDGKAYLTPRLKVSKPDVEDEGDLLEGYVFKVNEFPARTQILLEIGDDPETSELYAVNINYGTWLARKKKTVYNDARFVKADEKFQKLVGIPLKEAKTLEPANEGEQGAKLKVSVETFKRNGEVTPYLELKKSIKK